MELLGIPNGFGIERVNIELSGSPGGVEPGTDGGRGGMVQFSLSPDFGTVVVGYGVSLALVNEIFVDGYSFILETGNFREKSISLGSAPSEARCIFNGAGAGGRRANQRIDNYGLV